MSLLHVARQQNENLPSQILQILVCLGLRLRLQIKHFLGNSTELVQVISVQIVSTAQFVVIVIIIKYLRVVSQRPNVSQLDGLVRKYWPRNGAAGEIAMVVVNLV
jgi:hypothetical protein